jgi:hypothetical protein
MSHAWSHLIQDIQRVGEREATFAEVGRGVASRGSNRHIDTTPTVGRLSQ